MTRWDGERRSETTWRWSILKAVVIVGIWLLAYQLCAEVINSNITGGSWLIPDRWFICIEITVASCLATAGALTIGKS